MPINIDVNQALLLLGAKTLELAQIQAQAENFATEYNKLQEENQTLKSRILELESFPMLKEVGRG